MTHSPIEIWRGNDWSTEGPDRAGGRAGGLARAVVLAALDRDAIRLSFDTKVIGPLMLAKHLAPRMNPGGSFVIFSGVAATKIAVGTMGVAITNAATDTLARSLALELARHRRRHRDRGAVRADQHVPHRPDAARGRRRAADMTGWGPQSRRGEPAPGVARPRPAR
jgi:NAD(P)-dependent dehydrogenase (short-subunit alcohol dehydrogenase family)